MAFRTSDGNLIGRPWHRSRQRCWRGIDPYWPTFECCSLAVSVEYPVADGYDRVSMRRSNEVCPLTAGQARTRGLLNRRPTGGAESGDGRAVVRAKSPIGVGDRAEISVDVDVDTGVSGPAVQTSPRYDRAH